MGMKFKVAMSCLYFMLYCNQALVPNWFLLGSMVYRPLLL